MQKAKRDLRSKKPEFSDIFEIHDIQQLQDLFSDTTGVSSIIIHPDGKYITKPSNFCSLCSFIKEKEFGKQICSLFGKANSKISIDNSNTTFCQYTGITDFACSFIIDGHHIATWVIGHVRTQQADLENLISNAKKLGFSSEDFLKRYHDIPQMSQDQFDKTVKLLKAFVKELSDKGLNIWLNKLEIQSKEETIKLLQESEERYKALFQNNHSPMLLIDPESGKIEDANPAACEFYKWSHDELTAMNIAEINVLSKTEILEEIAKAIGSKHNQYFFKHRISDGSIRDVEVRSGPITFGERTYLYTLMFDVSDRIKAENDLQLNEEKYKTLIENVNDVIFEVNKEGVITYISPTVKKVTGFDPKEVIGKNFSFFFGNASAKILERFALMRELKEIHSDYPLKNNFGENQWLRISSTAIYANGEFVGANGIFSDITDKKLIEIETQKNESFYRSILSASPDIIAITDLEGKILIVSPSSISLFKFESEEEILNQTILKFIAPSDCEKAQTNIYKMFYGVFTGAEEYKAIKADGTIFDVEVNGDFIRDDKGNPLYLIFITRDITERKAIEEKIRQNEENYKKLIENVNDVIYEISLNGEIVYVSPAIETIMGFKPEEVVGRNIFELSYGEDIENIKNSLENINQKFYTAIESRAVKKNGQLCWIRTSTSPILKDGKIIGGTGTLTDISDRKLAEIARRDVEEKFSKAFEMAPYAITITNAADGKFIQVNDSFVTFSGYSKEEAYADSSIGLNLWASLENRNVVIKDIFNNKEVLAREYDFIGKNGKVIPCIYSASIITIDDKKLLLSSITDISENKKNQEKLLNASRVSSVISHINQAIIHSKTKEELLKKVCRIAIENGKFQMAWVGSFDTKSQRIIPLNIEGFEDNYLKIAEEISIKDNPHGNGPTGKALRNGEYSLCNDIANDPNFKLWRDEALKRDYRSSIALPLKRFGENVKALSLYSSIPNFFSEEEIALLVEVADEIGFALDAIETESERKKAIVALQESQESLKKAQEIAKLGSWSDDLKGNIIWSDEMYIINGVPKNEFELISKNTLNLIHPDDQAIVANWISDCISGLITKDLVFRILLSENNVRYINGKCELLKDKNGNPTFVTGTSQDITERILVEQELRKLSRAVEQSPVSIVITNLDGEIEYANPKASETTGYTYEELIGQNPRVLKSGETTNQEYNTLWETIAMGKNWNGIFHNKRKNGELYWETSTISPIIDSNGVITHYLAVKEDISEKIKTESELVESEKRFRQVTEQSLTLIWEINAEGMFTFVSPIAEAVWGYTSEELVNKIYFFDLHPLDGRKEFKAAALEAFDKKEHFHNFENKIIRKDGIVIWVSTNANPLEDEFGNLIGYRGADLDITERKNAEETLLKNEYELNFAQVIAKMGSWEHNFLTNTLSGSDNYYRVLGISPEQKPDDLFSYFLSLIHPDDIEKVEYLQTLSYTTTKTEVVDIRLIMPDNSIKWVQNNVIPVFDGQNLVGLKGVNVDITDKKIAEEEIAKQNEKLNAVVRTLPDIIFVIDKNGIYDEVFCSNPDMLAIPIDKFVGTNIGDVFDESTTQLHLSYIQKCIEQNSLISYEYSLVFNNQTSYFEARLANIGNDKVLTLVRDITERKKKDLEIQKLSLAVEQSPVIIVITDLNATIEYVNAAFTEITGYSSEEVIGKNTRILKSDKTDKNVYEDLWKSIENGKAWHGEWINRKKNGELYWENISINPIHDQSGKITNYLAVKQDITNKKTAENEIRDLNQNLERKIEERTNQLASINNTLLSEIDERRRIEEALSESEKSYRTVVENVNDIIFQTDSAGIWVFLNKAWVDVTGFSIEESIGQLFLDYVHPEDRQRNLDYFAPLILREKEYCRHEIRYLTKAGGYRWIEVFARIGLDEKGEITGTFGTLQDITERKITEEIIRNARLEAERANQAKSDFLSRMSHELRTPMNSILGFAQLLEMGELSQTQKRGVGHILKSGKHLLNLINEVLDISKIEAGKLSISLEPVQVQELISEMIDSIQPLVNEKGNTVEFLPSLVQNCTVVADRQRLKQILLNLLHNAVKYNKIGGKININCTMVKHKKPLGYRVKITVADTGIGIAAEDIKKLFTPFERIGAEKSEVVGTGLGLALVKKLVDAMNGTIGVESTLGIGSSFWIELPYIQNQMGDVKKQEGLLLNESQLFERDGKILYVEDNPSNLELVEHILINQRSNLHLISVVNGKNAIEIALKEKPDLILLDLNLPDMHGSEVLKLLQSEIKTKNIPVIIVSADAMHDQQKKLLNSGAKEYLTKPIEVSKFLDVVDYWIKK